MHFCVSKGWVAVALCLSLAQVRLDESEEKGCWVQNVFRAPMVWGSIFQFMFEVTCIYVFKKAGFSLIDFGSDQRHFPFVSDQIPAVLPKLWSRGAFVNLVWTNQGSPKVQTKQKSESPLRMNLKCQTGQFLMLCQYYTKYASLL